MLETSISILVSLLALIAVAALVGAQWKRGLCAHNVFERTHARLVGDVEPKTRFSVTIIEKTGSVKGIGQCPAGSEELELPRLDVR